jgi:hypothetical protein
MSHFCGEKFLKPCHQLSRFWLENTEWKPCVHQGEALYCFVTLVEGAVFTPALTKQLTTMIREQIAPFAAPDFIQDAPGLPKTR